MIFLLIKTNKNRGLEIKTRKENKLLIGEEENKLFLIYNLSKKMENSRNMWGDSYHFKIKIKGRRNPSSQLQILEQIVVKHEERRED